MIRDYLVSTFTRQNKTPLQAPIVIDIDINYRASKDQRCMVFVTHECAKWEHLNMHTDPTTVNIITSFRLLFLHSISVPLQIILQPLVDMIIADDAEMSQSIIGEIEYLEFPSMCPHEVVCHDNDETL